LTLQHPLDFASCPIDARTLNLVGYVYRCAGSTETGHPSKNHPSKELDEIAQSFASAVGVDSRGQTTGGEGLQAYSFDVAFSHCRVHVLRGRLLKIAGLKGEAIKAQHVLWMHAQKAQERW
jgi:hypothetical protein